MSKGKHAHDRVRGTAVTQMNRDVHSPSCQLCLNLTAGNWSQLTQLLCSTVKEKEKTKGGVHSRTCVHMCGAAHGGLSQANVSHPYTTLHSSPDTGSTSELQLTDVQLPAKITGACTNVPALSGCWVLKLISKHSVSWVVSSARMTSDSLPIARIPLTLPMFYTFISYLSRLANSTQQWIRLTSLFTL